MSEQAIVSAIMPAYNEALHIGNAIQSVIDQEFRDWELIVVDDGSKDDTLAEAWRFSDPRVKIIALGTNLGRGRARNVALSEATGKYIAVCDADDISLSSRFSTQVAVLDDHPEVDVVATQLLIFSGNSQPVPGSQFPETNEAIQRRFDKGRMGLPHASSMIRKTCFERFGGYCEECRRAQDLEFYLRIRKESRFLTLPEPEVAYRLPQGRQSLRRVIENAGYGRYARYRAVTDAASAMTYSEFTRRKDVLAAMYLVEPIAYARRKILNLLGSRRLK